MTKAQVKAFLAAFFTVYFGAVFLRIDYFPLSWVPMYGLHYPESSLTVAIGDRKERDRGFYAQRANGEVIRLSADDLNIPSANFRRLYMQRAFNNGPPQHDRERVGLIGFNRWWYETLVGPDPMRHRDYPGTLLKSINHSFGYAPDDPRRIVRVEVHMDFARFSREQLDRGEIKRPALVERRVAIITPEGALLKRNGKLQILSGFGTAGRRQGDSSLE